MGFEIPAASYDRFMGRYSNKLAAPFADFAEVLAGQQALDVGCGTGVLTAELVTRLGVEAVAAIDPSSSFVEVMRERYPEVDIRKASAEELPFPDDTVDCALAQLVIHFMSDPHAGLQEMSRVTRSGGIVAANVWDFAGGQSPVSVFWHAARDIDPEIHDESFLPGAHEGDLSSLFTGAGLLDVRETSIDFTMQHSGFEEWWTPYTGGVGPVGVYFASISEGQQVALRQRCRELLPGGAFSLTARAWAARGRVM